jgi:tetratricopeptide (TPR) repeat protein
MPKRTRSHIFEEESRKHLEDLIPNHWVIRKPDPDYGIDAEVEIFDNEGSPTGLMFFVQIKATDQKNLSKALKLIFKKDMLGYYNALSLPVLLVRYHSASKNLYARWAHSIDLYYSSPDTESYTITFPNDSLWTETTPILIEKYLKQLRALKKDLPLPIELSFNYDVQFSDSTYPLKLESKIRDLIKTQSLPIIQNPKKPTDIKAELIIAPTEIKISILEMKVFTMHNVQGKDGKYDESLLPHDLMCLVGCSFFLTGRKNIGLQILAENLAFSTLIESINFLKLLGSLIVSEKDFQTAMGLIENILDSGRQHNIGFANNAFMFILSPAHLKYGCPMNLHKRFADILLKICKGAQDEGEMEIAGMYYYNIANAMRESNHFSKRQVISWYKSAARHWKEYFKREYFWAEIGGLLFNCQKYLCSSKFYKKALAIEEKPVGIAFCADALLFAGRYQESLNLFKKYLWKEKNPDPEWFLKTTMLKYLIRISGIKIQTRLLKEACNASEINIKVSLNSKEEALKSILKLEAIIELDLLCTRMWSNLANLYYFLGETKKGFYANCVVCLLTPGNLEAWFACITYGALIKSPILGGLVYLAYEKNGEKLINFLMNGIKTKHKEIDPKMLDVLKKLIDQIREHHETHAGENYSVIRLPNGKNAYKEFRVEDVHLP